MKAKPHRKQSRISQPLKRAQKRTRGSENQIICVTRPSPIEFFKGVDEEEALAVAESLDERDN